MKATKFKGIKLEAPSFKYFEIHPIPVALSFLLILLGTAMLAINLVFAMFSFAGGFLMLMYVIMLVEYGTEKEVMINK